MVCWTRYAGALRPRPFSISEKSWLSIDRNRNARHPNRGRDSKGRNRMEEIPRNPASVLRFLNVFDVQDLILPYTTGRHDFRHIPGIFAYECA